MKVVGNVGKVTNTPSQAQHFRKVIFWLRGLLMVTKKLEIKKIGWNTSEGSGEVLGGVGETIPVI